MQKYTLMQTKKYHDQRGYFFETFREELLDFTNTKFVQDNLSFSKKNVLRGMHYQNHPGQAKFVTVLKGEIFDVIVDIRKNSPDYKKWFSFDLSEQNGLQLYIPHGYAHGFFVKSDEAIVLYKVSSYFDPKEEKTFRYNDPSIGITWPVKEVILSDRDREAVDFDGGL